MNVTTFVTDRELAEQLQVSAWFVQQQCRAKRWPHLKVAGRYRFTDAHVTRISELLEVNPPAETSAPEAATPTEVADISWGRSTRSSAQRARAARTRADRTTA
ncbi:PX domain-containing protein [Terrabacter terrigena]|uniref:Helix-turn-helix domain-containing protein n=1 Tax=Terrabacter terrigena TaxID=574718 RepID=A0ABW3MWS1_9MICO